MDNKGAVVTGTAILGVAGVVLAYYGYNHMNDDTNDELEDNSPTKDSAVATTTELRKLAEERKIAETVKEKQQNTIKANVELAIKELADKKEADKKEADKKATVEEPSNDNKNVKPVDPESKTPKAKTDSEKWKNYWEEQFTNPSTEAADYN